MRKLFFSLLPAVLTLHLSLAGQQLTVSDQIRYDRVVREQDLQSDGQALHPAAARAIARARSPEASGTSAMSWFQMPGC
ncbi:MAG TPA: hypothetical protein PLZ75_10685 [Bacteroidales bacterium]|nr:hypothetical protein [Bacteroidales bacterium]